MPAQHTTRTHEGQSLACDLCCKIPFGPIHRHHPRVIQLAELLQRSVGAVALKLSNFARLDPALQTRGNVAKASRLQVKAASRRQFQTHAPGRCLNPQPRRLRYLIGFSRRPRNLTSASRRQRAFSLSASTGERAGVRCRKLQPVAFFKFFAPEAREILDDLLEKYASDGELQLLVARKHLPDALKVRPISDHGNVNEIIGKFGGADQLRNAVNQLQSLLYAA